MTKPVKPMIHPILLHCARIHGDEAHRQDLAELATKMTDWDDLPDQAEKHGLGPLVYHHLHSANIPLPTQTKLALQGLYLRHRHLHTLRSALLNEILDEFDRVDIPVLVLKGTALAQMIYPDPVLRPMSDIDLLIQQRDMSRVQTILRELGFSAYLPASKKAGKGPNKHLVAAKTIQKIPFSLEVHHNLFENEHHQSRNFIDLIDQTQSISFQGRPVLTLGAADMLYHLCHHIAYHTTVWLPTRLIWVADIVEFAEAFSDKIDWDELAETRPLVMKTLSLLHWITPLSESLGHRLPVQIGTRPVTGSLYFQGWPSAPLAQLNQRGYLPVLYDSFYPPEFWLRLRYGLDSQETLFWTRWVRHPATIIGWGLRLVFERLGWLPPL